MPNLILFGKRSGALQSAVIVLLVSAITASIGQVLFKKGMMLAGKVDIKLSLECAIYLIKTVFTPYVFAGLLFYALSTLLWLAALSKCTLNFAYPFTAVTFVLVILLSSFILKEPIPLTRIAGMAVIIGGIFIVSLK